MIRRCFVLFSPPPLLFPSTQVERALDRRDGGLPFFFFQIDLDVFPSLIAVVEDGVNRRDVSFPLLSLSFSYGIEER